MCAAECRDDGTQLLDQAEWLQRAHALAARGQRVIAISTKAACMKRLASPDDVGEDLVLIGLFVFIDPPREEVKAAVAACKIGRAHFCITVTNEQLVCRHLLANNKHMTRYSV